MSSRTSHTSSYAYMAKLLKDVTLKLTVLSSWESKNVEVDAALPLVYMLLLRSSWICTIFFMLKVASFLTATVISPMSLSLATAIVLFAACAPPLITLISAVGEMEYSIYFSPSSATFFTTGTIVIVTVSLSSNVIPEASSSFFTSIASLPQEMLAVPSPL